MSNEKSSAAGTVLALLFIFFTIAGFFYVINDLSEYFRQSGRQKVEDQFDWQNIKPGAYKYIQFFEPSYSSSKVLFANLEKYETVIDGKGERISRYIMTSQLMENERAEEIEIDTRWISESDFPKIFTEIRNDNIKGNFLCSVGTSDYLHKDVTIMMNIKLSDGMDDNYLVTTADSKVILIDSGCEKVEIIN